MVKPPCSNSGVITAIFRVSEYLENLRYLQIIYNPVETIPGLEPFLRYVVLKETNQSCQDKSITTDSRQICQGRAGAGESGSWNFLSHTN